MKICPLKIHEMRYWSLFLTVTLLHVSYVCFVKQAPGLVCTGPRLKHPVSDLPSLTNWACVTRITSQSHNQTQRCSNLTLQAIYCYLNRISTSKTQQVAPFGSFFFKNFPGEHAPDTPCGLRPSKISLITFS